MKSILSKVIRTVLSILLIFTDVTDAGRYVSYFRYTTYTYGRYYIHMYVTSLASVRIIGAVVGCVFTVAALIAIILTCYIVCKKPKGRQEQLITPAVYNANEDGSNDLELVDGEVVMISANDMPQQIGRETTWTTSFSNI